MDTNTAPQSEAKTAELSLVEAYNALVQPRETVLAINAEDRKHMAASLVVQLNAHIDGRPTGHPDTFQQQLKIIEGGKRRTTVASLLAELEAMVVEGAPESRKAERSSATAGSKAPLSVPALTLVEEIRTTCAAAVRDIRRTLPGPTPRLTTRELLESYASAVAGTRDTETIKDAAAALRRWASAIRTMKTPPVTQELLAPCGACGSRTAIVGPAGERRRTTALVIHVREGASTVECRNCLVKLPSTSLKEVGAWVRGISVDELETIMAEEADGVPAPKSREGQLRTMAELGRFAEAAGYLPSKSSPDITERRLGTWLANKLRTGATGEIGEGIASLQEQYPSKSEALSLSTESQAA